jgi:hypothetical protein
VSFDDGERWQSLRLNMPATSIRDLVVHGDDIAVATHGRSFWILDDITPLRQIDAGTFQDGLHLFRPQVARRVRWNNNDDTPMPPEEPAGKNPPDGAIFHYWLKTAAGGPVTLEIFDEAGKLVRRFASNEKPKTPDEKDIPIAPYWIRPPQMLSAAAGLHRFVWDLHLPAPEGLDQEYPIAAIEHDTPLAPRGPWVVPGNYTVRLTAGGQNATQPLRIEMDPRVTVGAADLAEQYDVATRISSMIARDASALREVKALRVKLKPLGEQAGRGSAGDAIASLDAKLAELETGPARSEESVPDAVETPSLERLNRQLVSLLDVIEGADAKPTPQAVAALSDLNASLGQLLDHWKETQSTVVPALSKKLRAAHLPELHLEP